MVAEVQIGNFDMRNMLEMGPISEMHVSNLPHGIEFFC